MLFWWKSKKTIHAQCLLEYYRKHINNDPDQRYAREIYAEKLFDALSYEPTPGFLRYIGKEISLLIQGRDAYYVSNLMRLCYAFSSFPDLAAWKKHCTPEGYRALLICGSAHQNGYIRERCLRCLADQTEVLQFVLLRLNDWVPEVRQAARQILPAVLANDKTHIPSAMPFVEHVRRGQRAQRDTAFSMAALDTQLAAIFSEDPLMVVKAPITERRFCYRVFLLYPGAAHRYRELILYFIRHERDGAQRSALVRFYLHTAEQPIPAGTLAEFMTDKFWRVQLDAYEYRMKHEGAWDGLEQLLLSKSYPIREFAEYYLEKNGFDCLTYCREHLPDSLLALCDLGNKEDIERIRPYLEQFPREALIAMVRLRAEDSEALIWKSLHSDHAKLAKAAYRLAASQPRFAPALLLPEIERETDPQLRWRLIRLLGNAGDWEILPVLIRMTRDYSHIRPDIVQLIEQRSKFRTSISRALHDEIAAALHYASDVLPVQLNNQLWFDISRLCEK